MSRDKQLAKQRKAVGLTQHATAKAARISLNRLCYAESGRIALKPEERERVRTVLREALIEAAKFLQVNHENLLRKVLGGEFKHAKVIHS